MRKKDMRKYTKTKERDAQSQYVVIGTLAPIVVECFMFLCSDRGSGPEEGDVPLNQR